MTYNPPPNPYGQPYGQQPPVVPGSPGPAYGAPSYAQPYAPPPPKKRSAGKVVLIVVGAVVGLFALSGILTAAFGGGSSPHAAAGLDSKTIGTGSAQGGQPVADTPAPATADATPKASDFTLTPKITSKQCFGSAGCNVEYQVHVDYSGPALSDDDTWEITYEATGDESGPVTNQIEVTGTQYSGDSQSISTASSGTKIKITVTDVEGQ